MNPYPLQGESRKEVGEVDLPRGGVGVGPPQLDEIVQPQVVSDFGREARSSGQKHGQVLQALVDLK